LSIFKLTKFGHSLLVDLLKILCIVFLSIVILNFSELNSRVDPFVKQWDLKALDFISDYFGSLISLSSDVLEELVVEVFISQNLKMLVFLRSSSYLAGIVEGKSLDCIECLIGGNEIVQS
jgi:hypothetical protein